MNGRRDAAETALYELGIITDILTVVAKAHIGGEGLPICSTVIDWLASRQREQQERLEALVSAMWRAEA